MTYIYYIHHPAVRPAHIAGTDRPGEAEQYGTTVLGHVRKNARQFRQILETGRGYIVVVFDGSDVEV